MIELRPIDKASSAWRKYCADLVYSMDDEEVGANLFDCTAKELQENNLYVFFENEDIVALTSLLQIGDVKLYTPNLWFDARKIKDILAYCTALSPNCWFMFNDSIEPKVSSADLHEIAIQMKDLGYVQFPRVEANRVTDEGFNLEYPLLENVWVPAETDIIGVYEEHCFPKVDVKKLTYSLVDADELKLMAEVRKTGIQKSTVFAGPGDVKTFCGFEFFSPKRLAKASHNVSYIVAHNDEVICGVMGLIDGGSEIILDFIDVCQPYREMGIATALINAYNTYYYYVPFACEAASYTVMGRICQLEKKIVELIPVNDCYMGD